MVNEHSDARARTFGVPEVHEAQPWTPYHPRPHVMARRLPAPSNIGGRLYSDGYLVQDEGGHVVVMPVADFEGVYEPD